MNTISIRVAAAEAASSDMAAMTEIRIGVRENHLSVAEMAAAGITPDSIAAMLRSTGRAWIATIDGVDAGFSMADASDASIYGMFVRPGFEGRGLGRLLMAEAEAWLFSRGCEELWLGTDANPAIRAHGFYRRLGWRVAGELVGVDGGPELRYIKRRTAGTP